MLKNTKSGPACIRPAKLTKDGKESLDPRPMFKSFQKPIRPGESWLDQYMRRQGILSQKDQILTAIKQQIKTMEFEKGQESLSEQNDFEVNDPFDDEKI